VANLQHTLWAACCCLQAADANASAEMSGMVGSSDEELSSDNDDQGLYWEDCTPHLEDFEDWNDAPIMLCPTPSVPKQVRSHLDSLMSAVCCG